MKLDKPIYDNGVYLEEVNPNDSGVYFVYRIPNVKRGIRGKTKGHVDELLVVGIPWPKVDKYLKRYGLVIVKEK